MKTKYDVGETVLIPCEVAAIAINKNGIGYKLFPEGDNIAPIELEEHEIYSGIVKD